MKKPDANSPSIVNRKARFDYTLGEDLVVGISLSGPEVRAARTGHVQIRGAYVTLKNDELWLIGAAFSLAGQAKGEKTIDDRPRRLLAHRKQIDNFADAKKQGMTIVPTKLLASGRYIKLVIALGKGKKLWDKRQSIKERDLERESRGSRR